MKYLIVVACFLAVAAAQAVIGPDGHPVETPEVQHAKANHFAAKAAALQGRSLDFSAYSAPYVAPYVAHSPYFYSAYYGYPTVTPAGVPLDTPEVAAEKVKHFAAYAEALSRSGRKRRDLYTATYHGVPVDTYGHAGYVYPYGFY